MGKKKSRARVQVVWVSRSHVVLKLHKSVLARLVASYHDGAGNWETDTPIPLGALLEIMQNSKLANGARFFWNHPRQRGVAEPGLHPPLELCSDSYIREHPPGPNRLRTPRLRPKSPAPTP